MGWRGLGHCGLGFVVRVENGEVLNGYCSSLR